VSTTAQSALAILAFAIVVPSRPAMSVFPSCVRIVSTR
jgi:hypothetical protein